MKITIGKPIEGGDDALLETTAIAKGLSFPVRASMTSCMPCHSTFGGVYLPVGDDAKAVTFESADSLLRFVSDAQQVAFLGGHDVAVVLDLPEPKAEGKTDTKPKADGKPTATIAMPKEGV